MLVIADSSPLHYLVLIEHTAILPALFSHVIIPPVVTEELQRPRTPAPVRAWMAAPPAWLELRAPQQPLVTRAGRCWGLCRHRHLLHLKVHVRIPALEDGAQLPVQRSYPRLQ
jgi:hypothetical protein